MIKCIDSQTHLSGKVVLIRADLNVPTKDGIILDNSRITQIKPTVEHVLNNGGKVVLLTHFGRPKGYEPNLSTKALVEEASKCLGYSIGFLDDFSQKPNFSKHPIVMYENLRFWPEEEANDASFAQNLAKLGDIYVNEAFSCSHRTHASIVSITQHLSSFAGIAFSQELQHILKAMSATSSPKVAIIAGLKVSTKFGVLTNLTNKFDKIIIGGAMANTFLAGQGSNLQNSYVETGFLQQAHDFYAKNKEKIYLPSDALCKVQNGTHNYDIGLLPEGANALDVGAKSTQEIADILKDAKLVLWNGPLGYYEDKDFNLSTSKIASILATSTRSGALESVICGGDTIAAIKNSANLEDFSYVSTSGGAFLEYVEYGTLPGIEALSSEKQN